MLFLLGQIVATPGALQSLKEAGLHPTEFLYPHVSGDWGNLDDEDKQENTFSLAHGLRLFSSYCTDAGEKLWIVTEADRSATILLLPSKY